MASADSGGHEASVTVLEEDNSRVELAIRIRDLHPKKGIVKFFHRKKASHPQEMVTNASFTRWILTPSSLEFDVKVQHHHGTETSTTKLRIRKFPCEIEHATVDIRQPPGRDYSYLVISGRKRAPGADWKRYLSDHGTLDADQVDVETEIATKEKEMMAEKEKRHEKETEPVRRASPFQDPLKKSW